MTTDDSFVVGANSAKWDRCGEKLAAFHKEANSAARQQLAGVFIYAEFHLLGACIAGVMLRGRVMIDGMTIYAL